MISLPPIDAVMKRAQALAALDLILSPEWQDRYYSYNARWSDDEHMASMRNGSGDGWWIVRHGSGWAALKGLDHESAAWREGNLELANRLRDLIPAEYGDFSSEPAFDWEATSFAYVYWPAKGEWCRANDETEFGGLEAGDDSLLALLAAPPEAYVDFAAWYYEQVVPLQVVEDIYAHRPITDEVVTMLNPEITLEDIAEELYNEIGYPRA